MHYILNITLVQNLSQLFAVLYTGTHELFRMKFTSEKPIRTIHFEHHCEARVLNLSRKHTELQHTQLSFPTRDTLKL